MWLAGPDPARLPRALDMLLAAQARTFLYTADVVTAVENFPGHRGTVNGILKGFLGFGWSNTYASDITHRPHDITHRPQSSHCCSCILSMSTVLIGGTTRSSLMPSLLWPFLLPGT
ncbi:uncharacterized protein LOC125528007 [Triticum urartu]|uniref:uncharacterized protein LOC125528007 n=1 Tax=Triticum urartu TaxID=4572 RepID=UPI002044116A|nr:uncharacterized protein LOC125528007 [Triticum urartu]